MTGRHPASHVGDTMNWRPSSSTPYTASSRPTASVACALVVLVTCPRRRTRLIDSRCHQAIPPSLPGRSPHRYRSYHAPEMPAPTPERYVASHADLGDANSPGDGIDGTSGSTGRAVDSHCNHLTTSEKRFNSNKFHSPSVSRSLSPSQAPAP